MMKSMSVTILTIYNQRDPTANGPHRIVIPTGA
jgi:hypothetical protein